MSPALDLNLPNSIRLETYEIKALVGYKCEGWRARVLLRDADIEPCLLISCSQCKCLIDPFPRDTTEFEVVSVTLAVLNQTLIDE